MRKTEEDNSGHGAHRVVSLRLGCLLTAAKTQQTTASTANNQRFLTLSELIGLLACLLKTGFGLVR